MTLDQVRRRLAKSNLMQVKQGTGISYATLWRIGNNVTKNPGTRHVDTLRSYFSRPR